MIIRTVWCCLGDATTTYLAGGELSHAWSTLPPGAPTILCSTDGRLPADLNWYSSYSALEGKYGLVALDHRGHGRGIRSKTPFRLTDCADDADGSFG